MKKIYNVFLYAYTYADVVISQNLDKVQELIAKRKKENGKKRRV